MAFPQSPFKESVESHENISWYLVSKQKLFCTTYGATTLVGLPDACLQDLLLGLSRSCSNTNCHVNRRQQTWQLRKTASDNGTEFMSHSIFNCHVRGIMSACRVTSLVTCIQFQQFVKENLMNWYKCCIVWQRVIFSEHFGENGVILLQTAAKWQCVSHMAFFTVIPFSVNGWKHFFSVNFPLILLWHSSFQRTRFRRLHNSFTTCSTLKSRWFSLTDWLKVVIFFRTTL